MVEIEFPLNGLGSMNRRSNAVQAISFVSVTFHLNVSRNPEKAYSVSRPTI